MAVRLLALSAGRHFPPGRFLVLGTQKPFYHFTFSLLAIETTWQTVEVTEHVLVFYWEVISSNLCRSTSCPN
jgi:hypothetical protein